MLWAFYEELRWVDMGTGVADYQTAVSDGGGRFSFLSFRQIHREWVKFLETFFRVWNPKISFF